MNSKCGVQSKSRGESRESCICIVGFSACGYIYIYIYYPLAENPTIQTQDLWLTHLLLLWTNRERDRDRERQRETETQREYKKVQAVLGLETFTANFAHLGAFQGLPGRLH